MEGSKKEKTITDLSSVISFNIWKLTKEVYANMEKEGFHFGEDEQVIGIFSEIIAFMIQVADRMVYGKLSEEERRDFIIGIAQDMATMMDTNMKELLGDADYRQTFIDMLNQRFADYSEAGFDDKGPSFEFTRILGLAISEFMSSTDNRWVIEHVMDVEVPLSLKKLMRMITDVVGLKKLAKAAAKKVEQEQSD